MEVTLPQEEAAAHKGFGKAAREGAVRRNYYNLACLHGHLNHDKLKHFPGYISEQYAAPQ